MSENKFALIKASNEFWGKQLSKVLNLSLCENSNRIADGFVFDNTNNQALRAIVDISQNHHEEDFFITIYGDDVFENFEQTYKCRSGNLELINEGYVLFFDYRPKDDLPKLLSEIIQLFEKEATSYFKLIEKHEKKRSRRTEKMISDNSTTGNSESGEISHIIEYRIKNIRLTAEKFGRTLVAVEIKFLDDMQSLIEMKKMQSASIDPFA